MGKVLKSSGLNPLMWKRTRLTIRFEPPPTGRVYAGVPDSPDVIEAWIARNAPGPRGLKGAENSAKVLHEAGLRESPNLRTLEEMKDDVIGAIAPVTEEVDENGEEREFSSNVFLRDENGIPVVLGSNVRAHLKQAADEVAKLLKRKTSAKALGLPDELKQFASKVRYSMWIMEPQLPFYKVGSDGEFVLVRKPDGVHTATAQVKGARGPRSCIHRHEFIDNAVLQCTVLILRNSEVADLRYLQQMLDYGAISGFGAKRSMTHGRYGTSPNSGWELEELD